MAKAYRDFSKAFAFFAASAAQGNAGGQLNLGLMYGMGQGTQGGQYPGLCGWTSPPTAGHAAKAAYYPGSRPLAHGGLGYGYGACDGTRCRQSNFKACS